MHDGSEHVEGNCAVVRLKQGIEAQEEKLWIDMCNLWAQVHVRVQGISFTSCVIRICSTRALYSGECNGSKHRLEQ